MKQGTRGTARRHCHSRGVTVWWNDRQYNSCSGLAAAWPSPAVILALSKTSCKHSHLHAGISTIKTRHPIFFGPQTVKILLHNRHLTTPSVRKGFVASGEASLSRHYYGQKALVRCRVREWQSPGGSLQHDDARSSRLQASVAKQRVSLACLSKHSLRPSKGLYMSRLRRLEAVFSRMGIHAHGAVGAGYIVTSTRAHAVLRSSTLLLCFPSRVNFQLTFFATSCQVTFSVCDGFFLSDAG